MRAPHQEQRRLVESEVVPLVVTNTLVEISSVISSWLVK